MRNVILQSLDLIKFATGFPRAVLNKPLTNSRALIWCREACDVLNSERYYEHVLELLGVSKLSKKDAEKFLSLAKEIISKSKHGREKETLLHHLKAPEYLIDSGEWRASFFKTLLWASVPVKENNQKEKEDQEIEDQGREEKKNIDKLWNEMLSMIGWNDWNNIEKKIETARKLTALGTELLEKSTSK